MSALRRALAWGFLAAIGFLAAEVLHTVHRPAPVVLVPDTVGPLMWPVCVPVGPDSLRTVIRWWPARPER